MASEYVLGYDPALPEVCGRVMALQHKYGDIGEGLIMRRGLCLCKPQSACKNYGLVTTNMRQG